MLDSTKCCVVLGMFFTLPALCGCGGVNSASTTPPPPAVHNEWTWVGGSQTADQPGIYGTKGAPSASNSPGSRVLACSWTDLSGDFWLFGGYGFASTSAMGDFNDLWEYSNGQWAWMGGSSGNRAGGSLRNAGNLCSSEFPRRALAVHVLDRFSGELLALRWARHRFDRSAGQSGRFMEV